MKEPRQYRRQPIKVQAIQYTGDNRRSVLSFSDPDRLDESSSPVAIESPMIVETRWGEATVQEGDWIIRASGTIDVVVLSDREFQRTHGR